MSSPKVGEVWLIRSPDDPDREPLVVKLLSIKKEDEYKEPTEWSAKVMLGHAAGRRGRCYRKWLVALFPLPETD